MNQIEFKFDSKNNYEYIKKYGFKKFDELCKLHKMTKIELYYNDMTGKYIELIIKSLIIEPNKFQCFTTLNFGGNYINIDNIKLIAELLKNNKYLINLILYENYINNNKIKYICESLKINKCLKVLNLRYNYITNKGVVFILEALKSNESLIELDLIGNDIDYEGHTIIENLIKIKRERAREKICFVVFLQMHLKSEFLEFFDEFSY